MTFQSLPKFIFLLSILIVYSSCKKENIDETTISYEYSLKGDYNSTVLEQKDADGNNLYRIYYPEDFPLAKSPIVIWGNGTGALPDNYDALLKHLATWGFVVIDTYSKITGNGSEMLGALDFLISENKAPNSIFYQKLDTINIGTAGHSQGSIGAINSHTKYASGNRIKTIVPIALPSLSLCNPNDKYDASLIKASLLILGGTKDFIISPKSANQKAYDLVANAPAAMVLLKQVGHHEIFDDGGLHRGLLTSWLAAQLLQDTKAKKVYEGSNPEILNLNIVSTAKVKNF